MLAEPKRKTVWSLNPRGKYWSEDKSKIGQKLLESMGWKEGLGLGKNNNGIKDHIKVNINSDNKGLGYKPSADNVWVDKNDDFEQLLANLAVHHNNGFNKHEVKVSNLEETSKKLRNRLHYSKLIKSKNLSQCSEKDLISIFPKKRQNSNQTKSSHHLTENHSEQQIKSADNTFQSSTNINDYFKSKMDQLKLKSRLKVNQFEADKHQTINEDINNSFEDNTSQNLKRKAKELSEGSDNSISDFNCNHKKQKSKKKSKRNIKEKEEINSDFTENTSNSDSECQTIEQNVSKKEKPNKKHKSKQILETEETDSQLSDQSLNKCHKNKLNNKVNNGSIVPKGYNLNNFSVTESLKNYPKICAAIERDKALSTTNLMTLKGYGCHSH